MIKSAIQAALRGIGYAVYRLPVTSSVTRQRQACFQSLVARRPSQGVMVDFVGQAAMGRSTFMQALLAARDPKSALFSDREFKRFLQPAPALVYQLPKPYEQLLDSSVKDREQTGDSALVRCALYKFFYDVALADYWYRQYQGEATVFPDESMVNAMLTALLKLHTRDPDGFLALMTRRYILIGECSPEEILARYRHRRDVQGKVAPSHMDKDEAALLRQIEGRQERVAEFRALLDRYELPYQGVNLQTDTEDTARQAMHVMRAAGIG